MPQKTLRPSGLVALLLLLLASFAAPTFAEIESFGEDGELYRVLVGRYGNLFGEADPSPGTADDTVVMILEVTTPEGKRTRHLVPGTDGSDVELTPSLTHDAGQTFLLWGSRLNGSTKMNVVGFDGETWTETIEVSGDPVAFKGPPRVAVTRDAFGLAASPSQRTILHLVWWEQRETAVIVFYSPITLIDGEFIGSNPVIALNQFEVEAPEGEEGVIQADHRNLALYRAASIDLGPDGRTVVVGLPQFEQQRIQTLRLHVMPASLNVLADEVRSHIIGAGRGYRASILGLGDEVRSHIIGAGVSLHGGVLQYIAEEVYFEILDHGATYDPEDLESIAHRAWLTALESGGSLLSGTEFDGLPCSLLHIAADSEGRSQHQVEVCLMSDRPVPTTGEGAHQLLISESGREALIIWEDEEGNVHYIESNGADSWTEEQILTIGTTLSAERALRVLALQARNR
ncbi:MAG: hypothetical protein AAGA81_19180 [Acidobacteriota bacterium]